MTEAVSYGLAAILFAVGVVGCVVPVLPGPLAAYAGFLCLLGTPHAPGWGAAAAMGAVAVAVTVSDSLVPGWGAKKIRCSKWGVWGSVAGAFLGVFFLPIGLVAGPFLGALAGELLSGRPLTAAAWGGVGAVTGFLLGTLLKLGACALMLAVAVWTRAGG